MIPVMELNFLILKQVKVSNGVQFGEWKILTQKHV